MARTFEYRSRKFILAPTKHGIELLIMRSKTEVWNRSRYEFVVIEGDASYPARSHVLKRADDLIDELEFVEKAEADAARRMVWATQLINAIDLS